jgi:AraC family transcriptional regulator of adaptative response/methylated-DNA-[protein]-cysteine methyltransferase
MVHLGGDEDMSDPTRSVHRIQALCRFIEANATEPLTLAELGSRAHMSPAHLQRVFKRITGLTPRQYAEACRLGRFKSRLKENHTVTAAIYQAGYGSSSRLYERVDEHLGMTPATYRNGGRTTQIGYTLTASPLGRLLVAGTERGICAVRLGDSDAELEEGLRSEFPAAQLSRDEALREWTAEIVKHLRGQQPHLDLPVDVQATAFQWRVWQELCAIPYGSTRTYAEIAQRIGQPKAVRAVGRACATNPVAVVVPCHRAVRTDGGLGGYRWGLKRKEKLLKKEREQH